MSFYPLRALAKNRHDVVTFTLEDGPCAITNGLFILQHKNNSPILRVETITKGSDISGVFEGDIISDGTLSYTVKYQRGFVAVSQAGKIVRLPDVGKFETIGSVYDAGDSNMFKPTRCIYRCDGIGFSIADIYGALDTGLLLNLGKGKLAKFGSVQQYAGITLENKKVYFGESINGSTLTMENGRCCLNGVDVTIKQKG